MVQQPNSSGLGNVNPILSSASGINWDVTKENYALIVITVLDMNALSPTEHAIEDLGNMQTTQADIQTGLAQIQQLFSLVEGSVDATDKGIPPNFFSDPTNYGILQNAASAYENIFTGNADSPTWNDISFTYMQPSSDPSQPPTQVSISVNSSPALQHEIASELFQAGGDLQTMFPGLFPPNQMPEMGQPLSLAALLVVNEIQSRLDNMPSSELPGPGGDIIQAALQYGGSLSSDPMLQGLSNVYKLAQTSWIANSTHVSKTGNPTSDITFDQIFASIVTNPQGFNSSVASAVFADAAANYYAAQNQTSGSSSGTTDYGGFTDPKLIDTFSTTLGTGQSNFQTQSQQNTSNMQQYSSQETSYDNIGQSIISNVTQAGQQVISNQNSH